MSILEEKGSKAIAVGITIASLGVTAAIVSNATQDKAGESKSATETSPIRLETEVFVDQRGEILTREVPTPSDLDSLSDALVGFGSILKY